jgi:hypothetical protein
MPSLIDSVDLVVMHSSSVVVVIYRAMSSSIAINVWIIVRIDLLIWLRMHKVLKKDDKNAYPNAYDE